MEMLAGVEVLCRLSVSSVWRCSPAVAPRRRGGARRPPVLVGMEVDAMVEVLTGRREEGRQYGAMVEVRTGRRWSMEETGERRRERRMR